MPSGKKEKISQIEKVTFSQHSGFKETQTVVSKSQGWEKGLKKISNIIICGGERTTLYAGCGGYVVLCMYENSNTHKKGVFTAGKPTNF